jgi:hypothetical protein
MLAFSKSACNTRCMILKPESATSAIDIGLHLALPYTVPHHWIGGEYRDQASLEEIQRDNPDVANPLVSRTMGQLLRGEVSMALCYGATDNRHDVMRGVRATLIGLTLGLHLDMPGWQKGQLSQRTSKIITGEPAEKAIFEVPFLAVTPLRERLEERFPRLHKSMQDDVETAMSGNDSNAERVSGFMERVSSELWYKYCSMLPPDSDLSRGAAGFSNTEFWHISTGAISGID